MKLILTDLFKVKKILDIDEKDLAEIITNNPTYQILSPKFDHNPELESLIPLELDSYFYIINKMEQLPENKNFSIHTHYNEDQLRENFFSNLNKKRINKAKKMLKDLSKDKDVYYRIFHHSYKMYYSKDYSIKIMEEIISLCDQKEFHAKNNEDLIFKMQSMGFSQILVSMMINLLNTNFTRSRNKVDLWAMDATTLFGTLSILTELLSFTISFSDDLIKSKSIFESDRSVLTAYEAGFMDAWRPVRILRNGNPDIIKKCLELKQRGTSEQN